MQHRLRTDLTAMAFGLVAAACLFVASEGCHSPTDLGCIFCGIKPHSSAEIDITATGHSINPTVLPGSAVTFRNQDSVQHQIAPDPTSNSPCPELTGPVMAPGSSFRATMANQVETCTYIDQLNPDDTRYHGTIFVGYK